LKDEHFDLLFIKERIYDTKQQVYLNQPMAPPKLAPFLKNTPPPKPMAPEILAYVQLYPSI